MTAAEDYKRVVHYIFRALAKPQPPVTQETEVRLTLKCGVATDIQLIGDYVAFSATIKLSNSPSSDLLMDLLQANLDVTNNPSITLGALTQTREVVVWTKQGLGQADEREIVNLFDRFAHCVEAIQRRIATADSSGGVSRSPLPRSLKTRSISNLYNASLPG